MKNINTLRYALLCISFFIGQFAIAAEINVKVKAVRNNKGSIICGLFTSQKGFPSESKGNALAVQKVASVKPEVECRFNDLKMGTYAISVLHDENNNEKMDTNFLGIPKEGYGASLNHYHATSPPTFTENKFNLTETEKKEIVIELQN
jgi:uncharacterized protein (DUF2141 family)